MSYAIRPFTAEDAPGVASVILPMQQQEFEIPITLEQQPDLLDIAGFYQQAGGNFWVAVWKGEIVGTIGLLAIGGGQGALRKMFVERRHRGSEHGVAQALLRTLLQWARAEEIETIFLGTTEKFLAAHRFYERKGFTEIARDLLPSSFPVMAVDSKFYRLSVGGNDV